MKNKNKKAEMSGIIILILVAGAFFAGWFFGPSIFGNSSNSQQSGHYFSCNSCCSSTTCDYSSYENEIEALQLKYGAMLDTTYWAINDLTNIKGNYCYGTPTGSQLTYCINYVSLLQNKVSANFQNAQNGIKSSQYSIFP